MKERPIIFSAPMVQAILEGRKTQTRRIVKTDIANFLEDGWEPQERMYETRDGDIVPAHTLCPFGQPGDRLWVRETWQITRNNDLTPSEVDGAIKWYHNPDHMKVVFRADADPSEDIDPWGRGKKKWRPSIHMPRAASRILLEITDVRVERLREITEDDAMSEGVLRKSPVYWQSYLGDNRNTLSSRDSFWTLWSSIHGPESWSENPWVWVITFKRIEP